MQKLIFLELNEVNFEAVLAYADSGKLPTLSKLIRDHGLSETTSEARYEELEPWIQWVTAHTGKTLAEHGVFRLGDIVKHEIQQIWEELESQGVSVGAISPMNAKNRTKSAQFFVPDPWTKTDVSGSYLLKRLYDSIAQAVNDNSQGRLTASSLFWLLAGAAAYARPVNYGRYTRLALQARSRPWAKAIFLDTLLADVFVKLMRRRTPDFASLFLNAAAHIQHHYMFSSSVYSGDQRNPEWYVRDTDDPVLTVYSAYDTIVKQVIDAFPEARLMLASGLHQDPHPQLTYYWRLRNHAEYLDKIGVPFSAVEPRMSRDFLISCDSIDQARVAESVLRSASALDGVPMFSVDNRGNDLFVMLEYPGEIDEEFEYSVGERRYSDMSKDVAFVAIKNGQHNGIGYLLDTGVRKAQAPKSIPLAGLFDYVKEVFAPPQVS